MVKNINLEAIVKHRISNKCNSFYKNAGFMSLVETQQIFCKTKFTIRMIRKLIGFLSWLKNAEDRLYNATITETIECILITINSKRRDFSFAKY